MRLLGRLALYPGLILFALLATSNAALASPTSATTASIADGFLRWLFVRNDPTGAYVQFADPNLIQHDPQIGDGVAGLERYFADRTRSTSGDPPPTAWVNVIDNVMVDADLFAVKRHIFTGPGDRGRVVVDIWRVADGRIVEHWDVIQAVPETTLNGNTMWCGKGSDYASAKSLGDTLAHPTCGDPSLSTTRAQSLAVIDAYTKQLSSGDVRASIERWSTPDYRQHSPEIVDGIEGAVSYLTREFGQGDAAKPKGTTLHVVAQGDLVLFHRRVVRRGQDLGAVDIDIFRVRDGRISEHWDVKQLVPPASANGHTMW